MAEPDAAGLVMLHDRGTHGAVQKRHRHLSGRAGDGGDHRDRYASPDDRCHSEQVHYGARQPGQPASQHVAHHGRHTAHRYVVKGPAVGCEQPRDLLGEERVAPGAVMHRLDQRCLRALTADLLDQLADLVNGQPGELYQLGLPGQLSQLRAGQAIAEHYLDIAVGADDQHGGVVYLTRQEDQQPQRRHVRPVQVIEDDQHRPFRRPPAQVRGRHVIGTEAFRGLIA
jgi:hypothetical protein